jgi:hypothetical protein
MAKKTGTRTSAIETTPRYRKRKAARRLAEEQAWEEQSGPVLIRMGDHEIYAKSQARADIQAARNLLLALIDGSAVRPSPQSGVHVDAAATVDGGQSATSPPS